jgi:hypothetical protein
MPDSPTPVFPDLPEVIEPAWVKTLTPAERVKYEAQVKEGFDINFAEYVKLITSLPGFESVPLESAEHLATRVAIFIQSIYNNGLQDGQEWRHEVDARALSRARSVAMNAISAGYGGLG